MKVSKKTIQKWIDALRSGKYSQTQGQLQDTNGYCCLGVACKVFIPAAKREIHPLTASLLGNLPTYQKFAPKWLKQITHDFDDKTGSPLDSLNDCSLVYDNYGNRLDKEYPPFTFDEIADVLQAVYIEKVLD